MKLPKELATVTPLSKILAAILFISLPFIGYFIGVRYQEMLNLAKSQQEGNNVSIVRVPTPTPIAIPTIEPSITASWKTYKAPSLYQISYPLDKYSIRSFIDPKAEYLPIIIDANDSFREGTRITIIIDENPNNLSLNNAKDLFGIKNDRSRCVREASNEKNIKEISLGNEKAFEMNNCSSGLAGTERQVITIKNNKVFNFIVEYGRSGTPDMQVVDQILSTFQFSP